MTETTPTPIAAPIPATTAEAAAKAKVIAVEVAINKIIDEARSTSQSFVRRYWPLAVGTLLALTRFL